MKGWTHGRLGQEAAPPAVISAEELERQAAAREQQRQGSRGAGVSPFPVGTPACGQAPPLLPYNGQNVASTQAVIDWVRCIFAAARGGSLPPGAVPDLAARIDVSTAPAWLIQNYGGLALAEEARARALNPAEDALYRYLVSRGVLTAPARGAGRTPGARIPGLEAGSPARTPQQLDPGARTRSLAVIGLVLVGGAVAIAATQGSGPRGPRRRRK